MKNIIALLSALIFITIISACKKENNGPVQTCYYVAETAPMVMNVPDSVHTDSIAPVAILFRNEKHCQRFSSFSSSTVDSTTTIAILTRIDTCNCNDQMDLQTHYFRFQAPSNPVHSIIRIHVSDSLYYQDTIVVY